MVSSFDNAVFVYLHRDTGEICALYREDAIAMTGRVEWVHVGSLEPRAWIESSWNSVMQAHGVLRALKNLVATTQHLEVCPGTLNEAREAIKAAAEPQYWRAQEQEEIDRDLDRAILVSQWMVFASKLPEGRERSELNKDIFAAAERIVARHGEWKQK